MVTVGIVSPGFMGAGLGGALRAGGARVVATVAGRSPRTARLAAEAGLELLPGLTEVIAAADVVLSVTPPGQAITAAQRIAEAARKAGKTAAAGAGATGTGPAGTGATGTGPAGATGAAGTGPAGMTAAAGAGPIVVDLNAVSPATMAKIAGALTGLPVVDGSISGPPPSARPGARIYLSGPRAAEIAALPWDGQVEPIVLDGAALGSASALKMCTASVYKGLTALVTQAMRTAGQYDVLDHVLADLARNDLDNSAAVAVSATKAHRFVDEMREIAATQADAGLTPALFEAFAAVYADVAGTELAQGDPESAGRAPSPAEIVRRLRSF